MSQLEADSAAERRERTMLAIKAKTGIDEAMIERLVTSFYARVRRDPMLGPIFAARVDDWDAHIQKLCAFWSSVALMSGRYHGQPMPVHMRLPIDGAHFDKWLRLFEETANEVCPPAAVEHFMERARRIADSLEMGIAMQQGRIHQPRHQRAAAGAARTSD